MSRSLLFEYIQASCEATQGWAELELDWIGVSQANSNLLVCRVANLDQTFPDLEYAWIRYGLRTGLSISIDAPIRLTAGKNSIQIGSLDYRREGTIVVLEKWLQKEQDWQKTDMATELFKELYPTLLPILTHLNMLGLRCINGLTEYLVASSMEGM